MISVFEKLGISADKWNRCIDNDFNQIEWTGEPQCTEEEFNNAKAELQAEYDSKQYQRDRSNSYPAIGDQLDMLFHAIDAGTLDKSSDFYTTLKAVKDKYPKG